MCAIVHQHTQEAAQALHGDVATAAAAVAPREGEPVVLPVGEAGDGHAACCPHG